MNKYYKERSIWNNLGLSLVAALPVAFVGLLIITLIEWLGDGITAVQMAGNWWLLIVAGFIISLIYFVYFSNFKYDYDRKKFVEGLVFYLDEKYYKHNKPSLSESERKLAHNLLEDRAKVWSRSDPKLWNEYYPNEKYSKGMFEMVDNFMEYTNSTNKKVKKSK